MEEVVNKLMIIGNVGRDPEMRHTKDGKAVCSFTVAVSEGKNKDPLWLRVNAWEKTAELCTEYLAKGHRVFIEGRLQVREYEKDGQTKTSVELTAQTVQFLTPRQEQAPRAPERAVPPLGDDDIPF